MRAVIFAGPSLPPNARPDLGLAIDWRAPVRQGDLYRAALEQPDVIGVVDGYFEIIPTVWHKEILWAMAHGIHVFGAASMGALRAAELDEFGMHGIGPIYRDFRDGRIQDDDEVALLHGPVELGYPPLTEAMVNIRATLAAAVQAGVIESASDLINVAKALFYKDRTYARIIADSKLDLSQFNDWLRVGRVDQKRNDALALLEAIRLHLLAGAKPMQVEYEFADTAAWQAVQRD